MAPGPFSATNVAERLGSVLDALRRARPRVHCITSPVAAERTANTLLALGARPSLTVNPEEIDDFVTASDALLINLGMLDPLRTAAIPRAIARARAEGKPWVLDPAFGNVSGLRGALCLQCLDGAPTVLKANGEEATLLDRAPTATLRIATGATDVLSAGGRTFAVQNGDPMGASVTAIGCALGAVIAAHLAVETDVVLASLAAVTGYGIAMERAASCAEGPGSFGIRLYDGLAALDSSSFQRFARIS